MSSAAVVWIHEEDLSPNSPALQAAGERTPAVFVIDTGWLRDERISLKRVVFMYECALELPVVIRKGDPVEVIRAFTQEHQADTVFATASPDPRLRRQGDALQAQWVEPPPFVVLPKAPDLKRFSRYWRKAERKASTPTENQ
ncbi:MAG: hypothetical protein AAF750_16510 [Planctomycetota bacterium]